MLRHLFSSLWLGILLLALFGCGRSATAPAGEGATSVTPTSATPSPAIDERSAGNLPVAAAPTAGQVSLEQPTSLPAPPATPTAVSVTPLTKPRGNRELLRGVITSRDSSGFTLDVSAEQIYVTSTTQVLALTKTLPLTSLTVGRSVVVQVARNTQGQLIAERISIVPRLLRKPLPSPERSSTP
jgi:hypothetical protein